MTATLAVMNQEAMSSPLYHHLIKNKSCRFVTADVGMRFLTVAVVIGRIRIQFCSTVYCLFFFLVLLSYSDYVHCTVVRAGVSLRLEPNADRISHRVCRPIQLKDPAVYILSITLNWKARLLPDKHRPRRHPTSSNCLILDPAIIWPIGWYFFLVTSTFKANDIVCLSAQCSYAVWTRAWMMVVLSAIRTERQDKYGPYLAVGGCRQILELES